MSPKEYKEKKARLRTQSDALDMAAAVVVALTPMLQPGAGEEDVQRRVEQLLQPLRDELTAESNLLALNAPRLRLPKRQSK